MRYLPVFLFFFILLFFLFGKKEEFLTINNYQPDIYVPPLEDSHFINSNRWEHVFSNNIPGLLPGPQPGDTLGLENQPELDLHSPIETPLFSEKFFPEKKIKKCLQNIIPNVQIPTLNSEGYYKLRFQQCNPYNGSYCQCTNNYIPLPTVGYCQPYNRGMEVCPYPLKVSPKALYNKAIKCMK
jgi:hypothetical protein